jgi:hypothetical protein
MPSQRQRQRTQEGDGPFAWVRDIPRFIIPALCGAAMGTITAFMASRARCAHRVSLPHTHAPQVELFLFDVSMSGLFAMVYGVLLIVAGLVIGKKSRPESLAELRTMDRQRLAVFSFAVCVVSSGIFCFVRILAFHLCKPFSVSFCDVLPRFSTKSG